MLLSNVTSGTVAPTPESVSQPRAGERAIAAQFEALLLRTALAPVAKAMGFYGDVVVDEASRHIAATVP